MVRHDSDDLFPTGVDPGGRAFLPGCHVESYSGIFVGVNMEKKQCVVITFYLDEGELNKLEAIRVLFGERIVTDLLIQEPMKEGSFDGLEDELISQWVDFVNEHRPY
jgi:hypothetical protein